jgi:ABC-type histidine transport system ATPase subunit
MESDRPQTGHIGIHWQNLLTSLEGGQTCLLSLQKLLQATMKDVKVLNALRRQARLKSATDQIACYREEIQTYKDVLDLSLQAINLYVHLTVYPNVYLTRCPLQLQSVFNQARHGTIDHQL